MGEPGEQPAIVPPPGGNAGPNARNAKIDGVSRSIDETIERIRDDARVKDARSAWQRRWDIWFRATTAILAVASPALVTYSTTATVGPEYKLAAILLSGVAGASATLQTIFAWQQSYVRNSVDALDLFSLAADLENARQDALQKRDEFEQHAGLAIALSGATKNHRDIIIGRQREELARMQRLQTPPQAR